jgi:hypothetical protein
MGFPIVGAITDVEVIAAGRSIHQIQRLRKFYGTGRWPKLKGIALVRTPNDEVRRAELH